MGMPSPGTGVGNAVSVLTWVLMDVLLESAIDEKPSILTAGSSRPWAPWSVTGPPAAGFWSKGPRRRARSPAGASPVAGDILRVGAAIACRTPMPEEGLESRRR